MWRRRLVRAVRTGVVFGGIVAAGGVAVGGARAQARVATRAPQRDVVHVDLAYAEGFARDGRRNSLDLYVPGGTPRPPVVMFVHGGAWTGGQKEHGVGLAHALLAHGIAVACINTRMFPFAKPADMVDDCGRALAWLHRHAGAYGADGERLFVMGHSAGGHLVSWLALDDGRREALGVPRAALRGAIALSGVHELRVRHPALEPVFGSDLAARAAASPFAHASAGDPPMLLLWGQHDLAGLALCGRMLRDRLRDLGVPVVADELASRDHADYVFGLARPRDALLARIAAFVHAPPARLPPPPATASGAVVRRTVQLARGPRLDVIAPAAGAAATTVLWFACDDAERTLAGRIGAALADAGVAFACVDGARLDAAAVAGVWRQVRAATAELAAPAPAWFGGVDAGGALVAAAPLRRSDGLCGRIVAGSALAPVGHALFALVEQLAAGGAGTAPALLLVQGDGDPPAARAAAAHVANVLASRRLDAHLVQLASPSTAAALRGLGAPDDVLLPLLRAFVWP
jgi:acetyl esterase/lipase